MIYSLPSIIALTVKLHLIYASWQALTSEHRSFAALLLALSICNLLELYGFFYAGTEGLTLGLIGLKLYYLFVVSSGVLLVRLSLRFTLGRTLKSVDISLAIAIVALAVLLIGDGLITDYKSIGYAITRVPGDHYWVAQLALFSAYLAPSICLLIGGWVTEEPRCRILFFCSLPMVFVMTLTVIVMALGYNMNASVWFSSATTVFAVGVLYTESKQHSFALLSSIPGTPDHRAKKELTTLVKEALVNPSRLKNVQARLDQIMADRCLSICEGNISEASRMLGISPRTLKRKSVGAGSSSE